MTADELRRARQKIDMSIEQFARSLGYSGNIATVSRRLRRMENGALRIPLVTAQRVEKLITSFIPLQDRR